MSEQEVREFEENIVKGANIAFQRLVNQKKKEDGELVFSRNGYIFRVKAAGESDSSAFFCIRTFPHPHYMIAVDSDRNMLNTTKNGRFLFIVFPRFSITLSHFAS